MVSASVMKEGSRPPRRLRIVVPAFPAFNIYSKIARRTTALGPVYIGSVVNKMPGWEVEVIDENNYRRFGPRGEDGMPDHAALQALRPADAVGLYGGLSSTVPRLYKVAKEYRRMGVTTFAGGQHFTGENIAEGLSSGLDAILLGEAEESIKEYLEAISSKGDLSRIAGIAYLEGGETRITEARPPLEEFEHFPIPDFSLVRYAKISLFPISRVRGCGMNCEFCTVKGRARYASAERAMEQFMSASERWGASEFFIVDDLFGQDREQTLRLCKMLKEYQDNIGRNFFITVQIRLDKAKDEELLNAMREARVRAVAIGFESPIPEELKAMNKRLKPEDMTAMTRQFHRHGFLIHGMFIFGYPMPAGVKFEMSAKDRVRHFRSFIRKTGLDTIQVLLPVPLPGTEMTRRLKDEGRIFSKERLGWEYYDGNFPLFMPDAPMSPADMLWSIKRIMGFFYRFDYMFSIGFHTVSFPVLVFWLHNLKPGWLRWYKRWRNSVIRFGGWIILRNWMSQFKSGDFMGRLDAAIDERLSQRKPAQHPKP